MSTALSFAAAEPEPAPLWPLAFLTALAKPGARAFYVVTISGSWGSRLLASGGVPSASLGQFKGKILSLPTIDHGFSELQNSLTAKSFNLDFDDTPDTITGIRDWMALVKGALGNSVPRSTVTIQMGLDGVDPGIWPTVGTFIIDDPTQRPALNKARVTIRNNDIWLRAKVPQRICTLADWPDADKTALNQPYTILLGNLTGQSDNGALPVLYVDTRGVRYLICLGRTPFSSTVYKNGNPVSTGLYNITFPIVNGKQFTLIDFLGVDQAGATITIDISGYDDIGDGTGAPVNCWGQQLLLLLSAFAYSNYSQGVWPDPYLAPLDVESFFRIDDYLGGNSMRPRGVGQDPASNGRAASRALLSQRTALDIVNEACEAMRVKPYFNHLGKLALRVVDHREQRKPSIYVGVSPVASPHWIRGDSQSLELVQTTDRQNLTDSIQGGYTKDEAAGKLLSTMQVKDPSAGWSVDKKSDNNWMESRASLNGDLFPNATTQDSGFALTGGATIQAVIDDPRGNPDDDATYAEWTSTVATGTFRVTCPGMPPAAKVSKVTINWRARVTGAARTSKVGLRVGATNYFGTGQNLTGSYVNYIEEWKLNPATSAHWTKTDVDALEYVFSVSATGGSPVRITQMFVTIAYTADGASGVLMREVLSLELALKRQPIATTDVTLPIESGAGAIGIGDPICISHALAAGPDGNGLGMPPYARGRYLVMGRTLDLGAKKVKLRALETRMLMPGLWETDQTDISSGPAAPGIARLGAWRGVRVLAAENRVFARASMAYVNDPSGGGYAQLTNDLEKYDALGLCIEQGVAQAALQNAFINNFTGWTRNGNGAPASIAIDANDAGLPFYSAVSGVTVGAQAVKFLANTVPAVDLELTQAPQANPVSVISIFRKDDTGNQFYYWAQRSSDSKYFRESDQSWQVAKTWNPIPLGSATIYTRYITKTLAAPGSGVVLSNWGFGVPVASAVASQVNHLAHVQGEDPAGGGATLPVIAQASAITTAGDDLHYNSFHEAQVYLLARGAAFCQFITEWNGADCAAGEKHTLHYLAGDSNNYDWLYWDQATGKLIFERKVDGTTYQATITASITRGTLYCAGVRHVGEDGEFGLAPFTQSVYFGQPGSVLKGTDVVGAPHSYINNAGVLYVGNKAGSNYLNGYFRHRRTFTQPVYDVELQRLP